MTTLFVGRPLVHPKVRSTDRGPSDRCVAKEGPSLRVASREPSFASCRLVSVSVSVSVPKRTITHVDVSRARARVDADANTTDVGETIGGIANAIANDTGVVFGTRRDGVGGVRGWEEARF